jgi:sugar O-acyltransferase (sialic acid O-acetyltransferase NeuD family)
VRDLLILGFGAHAAEMAEIAERMIAAGAPYRLIGFIHPHRPPPSTHNGYLFLGGPEVIDRYPDAALAIENEWKSREGLPVDRLVSLIDPTAFVSRTATIGAGCVLYPHSFVGYEARVADRVFALAGCIINHHDVVEQDAVLAAGVHLAGSVRVEQGAYVGQSASVRQHLTVGAYSIVGMGAVVTRDVPPRSVVAGCPARVLRSL